MTQRLDDVKLTVRFDVESAAKDADKVERRVKDKKDRRKREDERREKDKNGKGRFRPDGRGFIEDIARGRVPIKRLGVGLGAAAGIIAAIEFTELVTGALGDVPGVGGAFRSISKGIKEGKGELTTRIDAFSKTKDLIASKKFAGRDTSVEEAGAVFENFLRGSKALNRVQIAKELLIAPEVAPILATALGGALKSIFIDPLLDALKNDPDIRDEVGKIAREQARGAAAGGAGRA